MATATLKRFDFLLKQNSMMAQTHNLIGWFNVLMDLRRNLIPFMPNEEFLESEKKFAAFPRNWRLPNERVHPECYAEVHKLLDEIYIIYLTTMKKKGLLMPKSIDTSKAVIEM